jgi:hypothetical protein
VATDAAVRNTVAGLSIVGLSNFVVNDNDIEIGTWDAVTRVFSAPVMTRSNAVRVTVRRDQNANGPLGTFFARILGQNAMSVSAVATAALTGQSTAGPGGLPVPVGISYAWYRNQGPAFCNQPIRFYPTNDPASCAGWHVYNRYNNAPDSRLRDTISDIDSHNYESPAVTAFQDTFEFTGGTMSIHTFAAMKQLFLNNLNTDTNGDGIMDAWTAGVPVYAPAGLPPDQALASADCGNPSQRQMIVGFATIVITGVQDSPVHQIDGYVICDNIEPGRGGGGNFGTMGSIPSLVSNTYQ